MLRIEPGEVVERIAAVVHLVVHVEGFGEVSGLEHGGEAALDRNVAAQIVGCALGEPDRVGADVAGRILGGENRDVELLPQLHVSVDVLLVERVLVPQEVKAFDGAADAHGVVVTVAPG